MMVEPSAPVAAVLPDASGLSRGGLEGEWQRAVGPRTNLCSGAASHFPVLRSARDMADADHVQGGLVLAEVEEDRELVGSAVVEHRGGLKELAARRVGRR